MLTHESRRSPPRVIFNVLPKMVNSAHDIQERKERLVWPANVISAVFTLFALSLQSPDWRTRTITIASLSVAVFTAYISLRRRRNVTGVILLIRALVAYGAFVLGSMK